VAKEKCNGEMAAQCNDGVINREISVSVMYIQWRYDGVAENIEAGHIQ
jgi:hypothetical protein